MKSYYITGGFTSGFILTAIEKHTSTLANTKPTNYNILSVSSPSRVGCFVGLGSNYQIGRKITLFGEIVYKTALSSVADANNYSNDGLHNYPRSIEILPASMDFSIGLMF